MTRDESLQVLSMILSHWHSQREWTKEEIDVYARLIQDLDAEIATHTVIKAAKETPYRPSISEFRERYRAEKQRLAPVVAPKDDDAPRLIPTWVKRWMCARLLAENFGKQPDDRRFIEQGDFGDLSRELMPDGAWVAEAESLDDEGFSRAFKKMFRN